MFLLSKKVCFFYIFQLLKTIINNFVYNFRLKFGAVNLKCRCCKISIHKDCKDSVNVACVPQSSGTPTIKGPMGVISDYAPTESPMVPAIIVHCVTEVRKIEFHIKYK